MHRDRNLGLSTRECPYVRRLETLVIDAVMAGEIVGGGRRSAPVQIGRAGAYDPNVAAEPQRHEAAVGQYADAQRQIDMLLGQAEDALAQNQAHVDLRIRV